MHRVRLGKLILDNQPYMITFVDLNGGARDAAVEPPRIDDAAGDEFCTDVSNRDVEHLDPVLEAPGHVRNVWRHHRNNPGSELARWHGLPRRCRPRSFGRRRSLVPLVLSERRPSAGCSGGTRHAGDAPQE